MGCFKLSVSWVKRYCSHFTDMETEAQRNPSLKVHRESMMETGLNSGLIWAQPSPSLEVSNPGSGLGNSLEPPGFSELLEL